MSNTKKQHSKDAVEEHQATITSNDIGPSLPPFVEGQLRCFLHLSVGDIKWIGIQSLKNILVSVKWWGQQSQQILLEPRSQTRRSARSKYEVKYPIRSGPKQFTAYLKDMGILTLDVLANGNTIGQVNVTNIGLLCHSRPIQGFYSIISSMQGTMGKEIGMLHVSLIFHSVSGSFNMTSSTIPTTDISSPIVANEKTGKYKHKNEVHGSSMKRDSKKKKSKGVKISSAPPERIEYSVQSLASDAPSFIVGPGYRPINPAANKREDDYFSNTELEVEKPLEASRSHSETPVHSSRMSSRDVSDALAELIARGQNLRNQMLLSTIETPHKVDEYNQRNQDQEKGNFIQNILDQIDDDHTNNVSNQGGFFDQDVYSVDKTLVDLVTGGETDRIGQILKKIERDSDASLSDEFSDTEDPIHEDSLLTDLFYTGKDNTSSESSVIMSDESDGGSRELSPKKSPLEDAGNKRPRKRTNRRKNANTDISAKDSHCDEGDVLSLTSIKDTDSMAYLNPNSAQDGSAGNHKFGQPIQTGNEFVKSTEKHVPEGMDLDTVTILARVQFGRVIIRTLDLLANVAEKYSNCTFFVEYNFPVTSMENGSKTASYSELTRCASNKCLDQSILFNHRSVFPVRFDGATITNWWDRQLTFKIYVRSRAEQTAPLALQPVFVGKQSLALRKVFFTEIFAVHESLSVTKNSEGTESDGDRSEFGTLNVSLELASEKGDIKKKQKVESTSLDMETSRNQQKPIRIHTQQIERPQTTEQVAATSQIIEKQKHDMGLPRPSRAMIKDPLPKEELLLKSLLYIPEGRCITRNSNEHTGKSPNCYLVCRMFWDEEASKSQVCWNAMDPEFNFNQVVSVVLNSELLERAKNNFMVVEVWNKSLTAEDDKLIGIVKVSLHPFYLSFKDTSIVKTLLKSQYPVIAVDGLVKISDLFHNTDGGHLQVLLALGTEDQIGNLVAIKNRQTLKPAVLNSRNSKKNVESSYSPDIKRNFEPEVKGSTIDHLFGISVENAKNLGASTLRETGERDCYVQYQFPEQKRANKDCTLAWHKTPTTLFLDNPVFGYSQKHVLTTFVDSPVQHLFLNSFDHSKNSSGITFEIWQRSYFPNIRDCLLYKAVIPIAKIYAMMAMNRAHDSSFQSFKLPLTPTDVNAGTHDHDAKLNVSVSYQQRKNIDTNFELIESKGACVCISVSVLRACGLKAKFLNQSRRGLLLAAAPSSINTFVKVSISFLGSESSRISPVIARSFAPTFSFHVDFPVNVIQDCIEDDEADDSSTLAFHLESGYVDIEVFQKKVKSGFLSVKHDELGVDDSVALLGNCRIPLVDLLSRISGIKGWFPLIMPHKMGREKGSRHSCDADEFRDAAGGLEVSLKFGKETDRELVINTARSVGWSPLETLETHEDSFPASSDLAVVGLKAQVSVEKVWIASEILEKWADRDAQNVRVYCRYKFYDKAALVSKHVQFEKASSTNTIAADLSHKKSFQISASSALSWYLREELIEFQFWLKVMSEKENLAVNRARDKLIGSVFIDASRIAKNATLQGSVSGLYPMYKFGADYLGKSSARISVHITDDEIPEPGMTNRSDVSADESYQYPSDSEDLSKETSPEDDHKITGVIKNAAKKMSMNNERADIDSKQRAIDASGKECRILIEEALHLPSEMTSQGLRSPATYASYQITPFHQTFCTNVVFDSTKPKWNVESYEKFDPSNVPNQIISFKVFKSISREDGKSDVHKDVLLGAANVDISLLTTGFRQIHGWYNLVDFSGQQVGQIKVGIIPEKPMAASPSARYFRKENLAEKVLNDHPFMIKVARPLDFEDQNMEEMEGWRDKTHLFNTLRDQMVGLDSLTVELRKRLQESLDGERGLSYDFHGFESSSKIKNTLPVASTGLGDRVNDAGPFVSEGFTEIQEFRSKDDKVVQTSHRCDLDSVPSESCSAYNESKENESALEILSQTSCNPQTSEDDASKELESLERAELSQGVDLKIYDSFDDVLNEWEKYHEIRHCDDVIVGEGTNQSLNDNLDNQMHVNDVLLSSLPTSCIEDKSGNNDITNSDFISKEHVKQVHTEEQDFYGNNPSQLQSKFLEKPEILPTLDLRSFAAGETRRDTVTNSDQMRASLTLPASSILQPGEDVNDNKKTTQLLEDYETVQDLIGDSLEEDRMAEKNEFDYKDDGLPSQSQLKEDKYDGSHGIPNFFMPPEMLAQSMQQLRLAVSRQYENASLEEAAISNTMGSYGADDIKKRFDRQENATKNGKISLDRPPPLETNEMNRIASIFSTKFT